MKLIPASARDRLKYIPDTGVLIWVLNNKHHPNLLNKVAGCEADGYIVIKLNGIGYKAHRIAWFLQTGEQPNIIDHINGIKTDNRFCNLRNVSDSENAKNHGKLINGSGLKCGVRKLPNGRYQARVRCDGVTHHLGVFDTEDEAHGTYKIKRAELFGQYSRGQKT